ncbi:hypothetical protein SODALDRAFT_330561 [Sodiomyces alkalinus F11]|uniref:Enhancer of polycomb-like protein n=1 Tax=Sodiomyces alkalinus (strain CBS 110278 / VKM F-3762 / F11) TaxID=1314773 RepID=A0A3N2Q255_SODAK|nr:hypothetical protein SODALDRAFT_330561 [Sodiomyces alkalinus F11]ROT40830.1 hypothetical protein SODALDRAFT_330561 [Sodiomyces alkalinus F11]
MTTEDDEFLKKYNSTRKSAAQLSEDDFERIMEVFEETAGEQAPFASIDNTVVSYDMMVPSLNQLGSGKIMSHTKQIYEYWKACRQEKGNTSLHPTLKFETHQETDDTDPYVCFRRREARQTRKTRQRDVQSAEKLKRLRKELEDGRQLIILTHEREMLKRDFLQLERMIFEQRAKVREMKTKLGIKGDDDDLVNTKPQRRKVPEVPTIARPTASAVRVASRPDGRSMDADLVQLADRLAAKDNELRADVEQKVQTHRKWNQNHIDLTRDPLSPVREQGMELSFRPAKAQYLMTPPASTSSDSEAMDLDEEPAPVPDRRELPIFRFTAGGGGGGGGSMAGGKHAPPSTKQPAFRRRIGRLNRLWIDRRGITTPPRDDETSDRWKYDQDDDEEQPVYEIDPFDTRALKFRATIPLSPFIFPRRHVGQEGMVNGHLAGGRPALPQPPQPPHPPAPLAQPPQPGPQSAASGLTQQG